MDGRRDFVMLEILYGDPEATIEQKLAEAEDLIRILKDGEKTADSRHKFDQLIYHAEQLLRQGADRERDEERETSQRLRLQNERLRRQLELEGRGYGLRLVRGWEQWNMDVRRRVQDRLSDFVRQLFRQSLPEFDVSQETSIPQLIVEGLHALRKTTEELSRRHHLQTLTLAFLVPPGHPDVPLSFCSKSETIEVPDNPTQRGCHHLEVRFDWNLPTGTWVVALGCTIESASVGARLLGTGAGGSFARLDEDFVPGSILLARLKPC